MINEDIWRIIRDYLQTRDDSEIIGIVKEFNKEYDNFIAEQFEKTPGVTNHLENFVSSKGLTLDENTNIEELITWVSTPAVHSGTFEDIENKIKEHFSQEGTQEDGCDGEWEVLFRWYEPHTFEPIEQVVKIPHGTISEELDKLKHRYDDELEKNKNRFLVDDGRWNPDRDIYLEDVDESWCTPDIKLKAHEMMKQR